MKICSFKNIVPPLKKTQKKEKEANYCQIGLFH
jgi:hypothetical protein